MPFGLASASAIFLRTIESVVQGIPCVVVRADDMLVSSLTDEEHLVHVDEVLTRLKRAGLRAKRRKCRFMEPEVVYVGYIVDQEGIALILQNHTPSCMLQHPGVLRSYRATWGC